VCSSDLGASAPDEWVMVHAHWDQLGKSEKNGKTVIYNGAVDNASGVAGVLTLANSLVTQSKQTPFERTLMSRSFYSPRNRLPGGGTLCQKSAYSNCKHGGVFKYRRHERE